LTIFELADKLKELKERKKAIEDELKKINAELEATEAELAQAMINEELPSFSRAGTTFYVSTKVYASPLAEKKAELFDTLKQRGYGDLIYETINHNTFSAFIKEQMSENNDQLPEWLNGLVSVYEKTTIGMRKSK
jgi:hypothetical protein